MNNFAATSPILDFKMSLDKANKTMSLEVSP